MQTSLTGQSVQWEGGGEARRGCVARAKTCETLEGSGGGLVFEVRLVLRVMLLRPKKEDAFGLTG